ncbi:MAG TPA: SPFH domain-containing protein [Terriglobales bacterium]|nr:SPFH domain-containing protein [Terriglobales bacterium]
MLLLKVLLLCSGIALLLAALTILGFDAYLYLRARRRIQSAENAQEKLLEPELKLRIRLAGITCAAAVIAFLMASIYDVVPAGHAGIRVSQISGTETETLYPGIHLMSLFETLAVYDTRTHTMTTGNVDELTEKPKRHETLNVTASEGLKIGLAVTVRYKLDPARLAYIHNNLPSDIDTEVVPPVVATVFREIVPNYTIRDVFAVHREDIRTRASVEITEKLKRDGITVEEVMLRDIVLPTDYARGLEGLIEKEQEDESLIVQTSIEKKQVQIAQYQAEAQKVRTVKQAEAGAQVRVLQAKAEADAMQYTLPLKEKQIQQTKLEAEARKQATIQNAEAEAQAKVIDSKAELEKQQLLASAEANRIRVVAAADRERLQGEAMALKSNPLLINKIVAEKLSDKIQVMMVPADGKFFFANDVLKAPAQQIFRQEEQGIDPPARPQGGPGGGR